MLAAWFRLIHAAIAGINLVNGFFALQLLGGAEYLSAFEANQLHALVLPFLNVHSYGLSIGIAFFAVHLLILGYLVFKSGYLPRITGILLIIASLFILVLFIFSDQIAVNYFHTISASLPFKILLISFITSIFIPVYQSTFQGFSKMKLYGMVEPLRISMVYVLAFILIHLGVIGVAYGYLIASVVLPVVLFFFVVKIFPLFRAKIQISRDLTKKLFFFGLPVFFGGMASTVLGYTDTFLLTLFRSLEEVGFYQVALPTSQLLLFSAPLV